MTDEKTQNMWRRMASRFDSWHSLLTGLGTSRDKASSLQVIFQHLPEKEAACLYAGDDIAEKIVDTLVDDAMDREPKFTQTNKEGLPELQRNIEDRIYDLGLLPKSNKAWKDARLYGGAGLLLGIDDGKGHDEPVDFDNIKKINWVTPMHRHDMTVQSIYRDPRHPKFKTPKFYYINGTSEHAQGLVHNTRFIPFHGAYLPDCLFESNNYWHDSVLNKLEKVIAGYSATFEGITSALQDFSQAVYKVKGLAKLMAEGDESLVLQRLSLVDRKRSLIQAIVIDAEGEDFKREVANLTGVAPVLDKVGQRLTAASKMPHTKLLGESPSGLGATGESEHKDWNKFVRSQQEKCLKPVYYYILKLIFAEKEGFWKGKEPAGWDVLFQPISDMSDVERADVRLKTAQADASDITNGVLTPEEVAISRYGSGKYSIETNLLEEREIEIEPDQHIETKPLNDPHAEDIDDPKDSKNDPNSLQGAFGLEGKQGKREPEGTGIDGY